MRVKSILVCICAFLAVGALSVGLIVRASWVDTLSGLGEQDKLGVPVTLDFQYYYADTSLDIENIETNASLIIRGRAISSRSLYKCGLVGIEVLEVLKGNCTSTIEVFEPSFFFLLENNEMLFYSIDGYIPMLIGNEYILYLNRAENPNGDRYVIQGNSFGKYAAKAAAQIMDYDIDSGIYDSTYGDISKSDFLSWDEMLTQVYQKNHVAATHP